MTPMLFERVIESGVESRCVPAPIARWIMLNKPKQICFTLERRLKQLNMPVGF